MKNELIWNFSLLIFGVFLVLAFTLNVTNASIVPSGYSNSLFFPAGLWTKLKWGMVVGVVLIVLRYLNLGILSILNKDLRLLVMLIGYSVPILLVLIGLHFSIDSTTKNFYKSMFPVQLMEKEISELRKVGMFKSHSGQSDEFVTALAIGRAIVKEDGWANSKQYWNRASNQANKVEILRLDNDKVWQEVDTEFVIEGNSAYEDVVAELGQISEENFRPTEIKETWKSKDKIEVSFKESGEDHVIHLKVFDDWADIDGVVKYINNEILDTVDYKFYDGSSGDVLIIGLTKNEREELSRLTNIEFREIK